MSDLAVVHMPPLQLIKIMEVIMITFLMVMVVVIVLVMMMMMKAVMMKNQRYIIGELGRNGLQKATSKSPALTL